MARHAFMLAAGLMAGACIGLTDMATAAPAMSAGAGVAGMAADMLPVEKIQVRRRAAGGRVVGVAPYRGGYYRGYGRPGLSTGAAVGLGVGAAALGILGAAAAANAAPDPYYYAPAQVYGGYGYGGYGGYGGCYIVRQPMYDDWGNYLGNRRVRVCD